MTSACAMTPTCAKTRTWTIFELVCRCTLSRCAVDRTGERSVHLVVPPSKPFLLFFCFLREGARDVFGCHGFACPHGISNALPTGIYCLPRFRFSISRPVFSTTTKKTQQSRPNRVTEDPFFFYFFFFLVLGAHCTSWGSRSLSCFFFFFLWRVTAVSALLPPLRLKTCVLLNAAVYAPIHLRKSRGYISLQLSAGRGNAWRLAHLSQVFLLM